MELNTHAERWIATRSLRINAAEQSNIEVRLGSPELVSDLEWRCAYQLSRSGRENTVLYAYGIDAFQALMMALAAIRQALDDTGLPLNWTGDDGWHGYPRQVPSMFGLDFTITLEKIIDSEIERFTQCARERQERAGRISA